MSADDRTQAAPPAEEVAEVLLREHPNALVCALAADGLTTPLPRSVNLFGQATLEGRALIDYVAAADRGHVIRCWRSALEQGRGEATVRLTSAPERWMDLHFLDTRAAHGVLLGILVPSARTGAAAEELAAAQAEAVPRFATLLEDERAEVLDCDEGFVRMFGYKAEEVIGHNVLEQIHPDDQARAVESWLAMLSTKRVQQARMRRRRKDGSWVWVDVSMHNYLHDPQRRHVLVEMIDVSAEMAAQEAIREREELLRRLMDAMPDGVMHIDRNRHVVFHNARLLEILHTTPATPLDPDGRGEFETITGTGTCMGLVLRSLSEASTLAFHLALARLLESGQDEELECDFLVEPGEWRRALFTLRALRHTAEGVSGALVTVLDVTDSVRAREELERRATYDPLTHCLNRSSIVAALKRELEGPTSRQVGVIYLDLDHFKMVNDTLGHAVGDEVLARVVDQLRHAIRSQDRIGRLGGDEFLIMIRGLPEPHVAMGVAERISNLLEKPLVLSSGPRQVTASLGVAWVGDRELDVDQLIAEADNAMYASKQARQGKPVLAG